MSSSNLREDESGKTLEAWTKQATPLLGMNAISGYMGIVLFYVVVTFHANGATVYNPGTLYLINNIGNVLMSVFVTVFGVQGVRTYSNTKNVMVDQAEGQAVDNPTLEAEAKRDEI